MQKVIDKPAFSGASITLLYFYIYLSINSLRPSKRARVIDVIDFSPKHFFA